MSDIRREPARGRAGDDSEQIQSHLKDQKEKERLLGELEDLLEHQTEATYDGGRLDALLDALNEIDPLPEISESDVEESLAKFHARHADIFDAAPETAAAIDSSPKKKFSGHKFLKIFGIAAALVVVLTIAASAFELKFFGKTVHWDSGRFWISDSTVTTAVIQARPLAEGETASYNTLEEAVEAFGITSPLVPQLMPDWLKLTKVTASRRDGTILICADYESNDGAFQIRYNEATDFDYNSLEKEGYEVELYFRGDFKFYLLNDMGREKAYWQNGELECRMFGNVTRQEMKEIVNSIY